jgi:uncharacterized membrane protein
MSRAGNWIVTGSFVAMLAMTSACTNMTNTQQRALTGGAIGAAAGAGIGLLTGAPVAGALIGGAGGAGIGILTK